MLYKVFWPNMGHPRTPSRFLTWDGKVIDASPALSWSVGMSYTQVVQRLDAVYRASVELEPSGWNLRKLPSGGS